MTQPETVAAPAVHLPPEQTLAVSGLARALLAATRNWTLYPPDHPAVAASMQRLEAAVRHAVTGRALILGVTPDALLIGGVAVEGDRSVTEAAGLLHERDILQLAFSPDVSPAALRSLLKLLALDPASLRARGGPARIWSEAAHSSITIEEIDYRRVLEDGLLSSTARKDDLWRLIVQSVIERRKSFDEASQQKLLEIAGDADAIAALAAEVMAPGHTVDGSPMVSTQAAAVLSAYKQLTSIVSVLAPERAPDVMKKLVEATTRLAPQVAMEILKDAGGAEARTGDETSLATNLAQSFDEEQVAQLLATTLAMQGFASQRLAQVFSSLAPAEDQRNRILTMTKSVLSQQLFGQSYQFSAVWGSMEELLVSYNDQEYMSARYRANLDSVSERAESIAAIEAPAELAEWLKTLGQDNVRRLSVTLLVNLLRMEQDEVRATDMLEELGSLAEDLLLSADYDAAVRVARVLARRSKREGAVGSESAKRVLGQLARSTALSETIAALGDMDDEAFEVFRPFCAQLGAPAAPALMPPLMAAEESRAMSRATEVLIGLKADAIGGLGPLASHTDAFGKIRAAAIIGAIGAPEGVRLLQPMLRGRDEQVLRAAVRALSNINDPAAARAIQTMLRTATRQQRAAIVQALVAQRDRRVVPLLVQILSESRPLGADHGIVMETLGALELVGDDRAIEPLVELMAFRSWLRQSRARALKRSAVAVLVRIGSDRARAALQEAAAQGDWMLRGVAREAVGA